MRSWKPYCGRNSARAGGSRWRLWECFSESASFPLSSKRLRGQWNWYSGNGLGVMFLGGPFLAMVAGVYAMGREQGRLSDSGDPGRST